jgi:P27 family predicted phage terminase small subunit
MNDTRMPIELLVEKGKKHLTKAEIEERKSTEVKVDADKIFAPGFIRTKKQKERFEFLSQELLNAKILGNLDCELLGRYILLEEQYNKIVKVISKTDIISDEYDKLLQKQNKVFQMLDKASNELGMNMMARCKIVVPKKEEKPKNKFEKFKNGSVANG